MIRFRHLRMGGMKDMMILFLSSSICLERFCLLIKILKIDLPWSKPNGLL